MTGETLITTTAQLEGLASHLRASGRFGFDTEFVSEDSYQPDLCLIQLAANEHLAIVDPLEVKDLSPLWNLPPIVAGCRFAQLTMGDIRARPGDVVPAVTCNRQRR